MYQIPEKLINNFTNHFIELGRKYKYFEEIVNFSIKNQENIEKAIIYVFDSGIAFQTGAQRYKDHESRGYLEEIASNIYKYFNERNEKENTEEEFDKFHEKLCDLFIKRTSELGKNYTYGNAQKLINMTFKYIACFKDYSEFSELFNYCHTPIDSIILENYSVIGVNCINRNNNKLSFDNKEYCWTKLDKQAYKFLLKNYRDKIKEENEKCSALLFDFYNWASRDVKINVRIPSSQDIEKLR